jgi:Putative polyhydroxyalkanoic acid system protein (PHA_gran_rgn)
MSHPLVVSIPHRLGRDEAMHRIQHGLTQVRATFGDKLAVITEAWSGAHCDFRVTVLRQATTGTIDVAEDHVRVEVQLPWLLGLLAGHARGLIQSQGQRMLEAPRRRDTQHRRDEG